MKHLHVDIETFSSVDIKKSGLYKYVQSPDFEILLFAYSVDGEPPEVVDLAQGEVIPDWLCIALANPAVIKHAYNAAFEWYAINKFHQTPLEQWQCTMAQGLYCGYPAGLAAIGKALGIGQEGKKASTGLALIKTFCVPCKPTARNGQRTRTYPRHEPEKWRLFKEYCRQDVIAELAVANRLQAFPMPEFEQRLWQIDQIINATGVRVDGELIQGALHCSDIITDELMAEATELSGLDNPNSVKQLSEWLSEELEEEITDLQKETVKDLLQTVDSDKVKRMLEIRQELSKTSVKKYTSMNDAACEDGRVRGLLQYYGASKTGRWAGRLVQVQNLPRNHMETLSHARQCVRNRKLDALKVIYGNVPDTLSQLIRTAFVPEKGHKLFVADFSAIEARVLSWLAGEQWREQVFATHGKIYEASASAMFGVPIEKITKGQPEYELRQKGKVAELALGYQGASGALKQMGALNMGLTEEELPDIVYRWRSTNSRIVDFWYGVENIAVDVVKTGKSAEYKKGLYFAREIDYQNNQDFLTVKLPNGRKLFYAKPFISLNERDREALFYHGLEQNKKWGPISTYGGKLTENITQAIARDCLAESIYNLHASGYKIVMHIHDEVVVESPEKTDLQEICDIMGKPLSWAPGLPLRADGFVTDYYKKE
ncbi:MAG: DNA polymerase [Eubacteriales bacterium]|jgi:DNA polymerase